MTKSAIQWKATAPEKSKAFWLSYLKEEVDQFDCAYEQAPLLNQPFEQEDPNSVLGSYHLKESLVHQGASLFLNQSENINTNQVDKDLIHNFP